MRRSFTPILGLTATILALIPPRVAADPIVTGLYRLHNHPDGAVQPPFYGLRLDGLFLNDNKEFTFDFDDPQSEMWLEYSGTEIHIFGHSFGGEDKGGEYKDNKYLGVYDIDFTYRMNVGTLEDLGLQDVVVTHDHTTNSGLIIAPETVGDLEERTVLLRDEGMGGFSFRFGDDEAGLGHRGFAGISGWGWLEIKDHNDGDFRHTDAQDWIFTAERQEVSEPSALVLLVSGLAGLSASFKRRPKN